MADSDTDGSAATSGKFDPQEHAQSIQASCTHLLGNSFSEAIADSLHKKMQEFRHECIGASSRPLWMIYIDLLQLVLITAQSVPRLEADDYKSNLKTARRMHDELPVEVAHDHTSSSDGGDQDLHSNHSQDDLNAEESDGSNKDADPLDHESAHALHESTSDHHSTEQRFGVGDLVVVTNSDNLSASWAGKIVRLTNAANGLCELEIQRKKDDDGPLAATGVIEDGIRVACVCPLVEYLVHQNQFRSMFGHSSLKLQGYPYFLSMKHRKFGNFCVGEVINVAGPGTPKTIAGFMETKTRPFLKVLLWTPGANPEIQVVGVKASKLIGWLVHCWLHLV